jgi:prepilin-type N-terminal cleavage/methylation domain-containing protein
MHRRSGNPPHPQRARIERAARAGAARRGFTLVEAMVAITITALAGAVLLLAIETTVINTTEAVEQTIAAGMARQLVDEVLGARYVAVGSDPQEYPTGPSAWEQAGEGRERFNDTDDFHNFAAQPPEDVWGVALGDDDGEGDVRHTNFRVPSSRFADWRQRIEVYYVDENDFTVRLPAGVTSNYRAVEAAIFRQERDGALRELARLRRVFAYVPAPN